MEHNRELIFRVNYSILVCQLGCTTDQEILDALNTIIQTEGLVLGAEIDPREFVGREWFFPILDEVMLKEALVIDKKESIFRIEDQLLSTWTHRLVDRNKFKQAYRSQRLTFESQLSRMYRGELDGSFRILEGEIPLPKRLVTEYSYAGIGLGDGKFGRAGELHVYCAIPWAFTIMDRIVQLFDKPVEAPPGKSTVVWDFWIHKGKPAPQSINLTTWNEELKAFHQK